MIDFLQTVQTLFDLIKSSTFSKTFLRRKNKAQNLTSTFSENIWHMFSKLFVLDLPRRKLWTNFFLTTITALHFAPTLLEKCFLIFSKQLFTQKKFTLDNLCSENIYNWIFELKVCSKNFDWCSPKCLNSFWYDKKNTFDECFPEKNYSSAILLQLRSNVLVFVLRTVSTDFYLLKRKVWARFFSEKKHKFVVLLEESEKIIG